jgi:hypothetical protein
MALLVPARARNDAILGRETHISVQNEVRYRCFPGVIESPSDTRSTRVLFWIAYDPLEFLAELVCTSRFPRHLPTGEGEFAGGFHRA